MSDASSFPRVDRIQLLRHANALAPAALNYDYLYNKKGQLVLGAGNPVGSSIIVNASRTSLNNSTDTNYTVLGTINVAPNPNLVPGSFLILRSLFTCGGGASKIIRHRINGNLMSFINSPLNNVLYSNIPIFIKDVNTIITPNNFYGGPGNSSNMLSTTITDVATVGFDVTFEMSWGAATPTEVFTLNIGRID